MYRKYIDNSAINPNLGEDVFTPCWFSLNNSETIEAIILEFCRIQ